MYLDPVKYQGDLANHEKMYFFSRDIIRVKNPSKQDFRFKYDSIWNTVKAGQSKDMERYLAERYCSDFAQRVIGEMIVAQGEKAVENYKNSHPDILLDKYVENRTIWDKMPRMDDIELNTKIWKECWVGIVEKYGEDREIEQTQAQKLSFGTSLQEQLSERFKSVFVGDEPQDLPPLAAEQAQTVSDRSLESEVTQDAS